MSDIEGVVALRSVLPEDKAFIFSSWLKSYRPSQFAKEITSTIFFKGHHDVIENILDNSQVVIACERANPSNIYGYIVVQMIDNIFTVHYCYVKHSFRRMGICKKLFKAFQRNREIAGCYTHHTFPAPNLSGKYNLVYHPYLMVQPEVDKTLPTPDEYFKAENESIAERERSDED